MHQSVKKIYCSCTVLKTKRAPRGIKRGLFCMACNIVYIFQSPAVQASLFFASELYKLAIVYPTGHISLGIRVDGGGRGWEKGEKNL